DQLEAGTSGLVGANSACCTPLRAPLSKKYSARNSKRGIRFQVRLRPRQPGFHTGFEGSNMRALLASLLIFTAWGSMAAPDTAIYDQAVAHAGRSDKDLQRDARERPAEVLAFFGLKPGMHVADIFAGGGYYSELISYVVGPK